MKNLNIINLVELTNKELENTNGGFPGIVAFWRYLESFLN